MQVTAGGQVTTGGDANVGSNGSGTATIDGSGSKWTANGLFFVNEKGNVGVSNGGQILTSQAYVDGPITVSGANATWNSTDVLSIGNHVSLGGSDEVNFNITSGGAVNSRVAFLGDHGAGIVSVDGNGSSWNTSEQLYVGFDGGGQFSVSNGAHVASSETQIGVSHGSSGTFSVADANSRWTNSSNVSVGVAGTGLLTVANSGVAEVDGLLSVGLRGTLEGNSHVMANTRNGGTVAPGLSTSLIHSDAFATLHVDGDYTQTAVGQLAIQLGSATSFDTLAIAGHATLNGTLHASLSIGFTPTVGESFEVLTATNGITGTFALNFETLGGLHGPLAVLVYSNSDVILKFINPMTADYNRNGIVDAADYVLWRNSVGQTGTSLAADGNGDGVVDANDFNLWRSEFGQSAGAGAGVGSEADVPEPSTLATSFLATLALTVSGCFNRKK
jgi:T5SS/PEP-CTERM-associated repeat protein